jgi:2'-5' RNA ligase
MRFIIFIVPPLDIEERIFKFQKSFPSNKVPYFYQPHITLKAPSGLSEDMAWLERVKILVGNHVPFEIKFKGLGEFDDRVLFLKPVFSDGLMDLHNKLITLLNPSTEARGKFFEGSLYNPHLTLGETTWGGMTTEELGAMKNKAETEFRTVMSFPVTFVRVYQKQTDDGIYQKFVDIPLKA